MGFLGHGDPSHLRLNDFTLSFGMPCQPLGAATARQGLSEQSIRALVLFYTKI
jgi:hypothetical protein